MDSVIARSLLQQHEATTHGKMSCAQSNVGDCRSSMMHRVDPARSPSTSFEENFSAVRCLHEVVYENDTIVRQREGQEERVLPQGFPDSICAIPSSTTSEDQSTTYSQPKRQMVCLRPLSLRSTKAASTRSQSEPLLCLSLPTDILRREFTSPCLSHDARMNERSAQSEMKVVDRYYSLLGNTHKITENNEKSCNRLEDCTVENLPRLEDQQTRKRKGACMGHTQSLTGKTRRECRRVKFSSRPDQTFDDPHSPILGEEAMNIWYQRRESKLMRVAALRYSLSKSDVDSERSQRLDCFRNIERYKNKKMAIKCIIMASQKWKLNPDDLATIARRVSEGSVEAALLAAAQDTTRS